MTLARFAVNLNQNRVSFGGGKVYIPFSLMDWPNADYKQVEGPGVFIVVGMAIVMALIAL